MRMVYIALRIFGLLVVVFLLGGCSFWWADPEFYKSKKLAKSYGGHYIFEKKFADEMNQREKERKEYMDIFFTTHELFTEDDLAILNKALPQTLSNGCKYHENQFFTVNRPEYAYYANKIKEYIGDRNYNKFFVYIDSYYECNETIYPIVITLSRPYTTVSYGLFGDEGRGFRMIDETIEYYSSSKKMFLINGKFVESAELENDK